MNFATHLIVDSINGLVGHIHQNDNPFLSGNYIVYIKDSFFTATTLDRAISCAMRNMPTGASLVCC